MKRISLKSTIQILLAFIQKALHTKCSVYVLTFLRLTASFSSIITSLPSQPLALKPFVHLSNMPWINENNQFTKTPKWKREYIHCIILIIKFHVDINKSKSRKKFTVFGPVTEESCTGSRDVHDYCLCHCLKPVLNFLEENLCPCPWNSNKTGASLTWYEPRWGQRLTA